MRRGRGRRLVEEDERERVEHLSATKRASSCQVAPFIDSYVCSVLWSERLDTIFARTLFLRLLYLVSSITIQGSAKRLRPGLVNMRRNNCVLLPAAGRRTQYFLLIFTKPGRSLFAEPCS